MFKITVIGLLVAILIISVPVDSFAQTSQRFIVKVNQSFFIPGDTLVLYGKVSSSDALFVKIIDPAGRTAKVDTIYADINGSFTTQLMQWPEPTRNFTFGTYTIEVSSSRFPEDKAALQVTFTDRESVLGSTPPQHVLAVKLDSPTEISVGRTFRIFVQVTFDGALVNADPAEFLASSHIHSGNTTINLTGKFNKLHEGIYYSDVKLAEEGSYIIHAVAFHRGYLAHDSKVVSSGSSIGQVQESINTLKVELADTSRELNETKSAMVNATSTIRQEVADLQQASGQINSLIIPILALISIIIALQISLFARIRASFK